jgi:hypothetical protein
MRQISLGINQSCSNCPRVQIIPQLYKIIFLISTYTFHTVDTLNVSEEPKKDKNKRTVCRSHTSVPLHIKTVNVNVNKYILSYLILSYLILSYLILSYLIFSYLILMCIVQVSLMWTVWVTPSVASTVAQTSAWEEVRVQPISEQSFDKSISCRHFFSCYNDL